MIACKLCRHRKCTCCSAVSSGSCCPCEALESRRACRPHPADIHGFARGLGEAMTGSTIHARQQEDERFGFVHTSGASRASDATAARGSCAAGGACTARRSQLLFPDCPAHAEAWRLTLAAHDFSAPILGMLPIALSVMRQPRKRTRSLVQDLPHQLGV